MRVGAAGPPLSFGRACHQQLCGASVGANMTAKQKDSAHASPDPDPDAQPALDMATEVPTSCRGTSCGVAIRIWIRAAAG